MAKRKSPYSKGFPTRSKDVYVTQGMLFAVRDELKDDIKALEARLEGRFSKIDARFSEVDARFNQVDARLSELSAQMNRQLALAEEQNAQNIAVMEGLGLLFDRQERVEKRLDGVEKTISDFRK